MTADPPPDAAPFGVVDHSIAFPAAAPVVSAGWGRFRGPGAWAAFQAEMLEDWELRQRLRLFPGGAGNGQRGRRGMRRPRTRARGPPPRRPHLGTLAACLPRGAVCV